MASLDWRTVEKARTSGKRLTKGQREVLLELRELLTLESASFGKIGIDHAEGDEALPKTEADVDAFINARTRLWRNSWVDPLITALLGEEDGR